MHGHVMQLQPFSVNDGDGIRTNVFLAGCPMRCRWCSNPEGMTTDPKTGWYIRKCVGCGECVRVCPQGIGIDLNAERDKCIACGKCADVCPAGARTRMVSLMDAGDIIRDIQKHRLFYSYSGGGITFSGGEATSQPEFLDCLTRELYDLGYSMDIETCGMFDWEKTEPILRRMDLIFMDLKMMDSDKHRQWTGVSNEKVLENIRKLATLSEGAPGPAAGYGSEGGPEIVIRIPVIGGVNDDEENIRASAAFVRGSVPGAKMELLPYHSLGRIKYEAAGRPFEQNDFYTPSKEGMQKLRDIVAAQGVTLADYR